MPDDSRYDSVTWWLSSDSQTLGALIDERVWVCVEGDEEDPNAPLPVFLNLARNSTGRIVCTGLVIGDLPPWRHGDREINAAALRAIRIPELVALALDDDKMPKSWREAVGLIVDGLHASSAGKPRPRWYDDSHFEEVARSYRHALQVDSQAPIRRLAQRYQVSEPTVRRWVQRSRDRGFLGASIPGKAGEQETTS